MVRLGLGLGLSPPDGVAGAVALLLQEHHPIISRASFGTTTAVLPLEQPTAAGSTLILSARVYGSGYTVTDNQGGSTAGGQWVAAVSGSADGPPVFVWLYRGCAAGITSITLTRGDSNYIIDQRLYFQEVAGLHLTAPITTYIESTGVASQSSTTFTVPGAGFFAAHVHLSPSRTPTPSDAGSTVRRLDFQDTAGTIPYVDQVSEHCVQGASTGGDTFGSTWGVDLSTAWWHGVFIPTA